VSGKTFHESKSGSILASVIAKKLKPVSTPLASKQRLSNALAGVEMHSIAQCLIKAHGLYRQLVLRLEGIRR